MLQEGHTAHATAEEAEEEAMRFVRIYEQFAVGVAGIPVVAGRKSRIESFAGEPTRVRPALPVGKGASSPSLGQRGWSHHRHTFPGPSAGHTCTCRGEAAQAARTLTLAPNPNHARRRQPHVHD